jgi:hypothetical protein
MAYAISKWNKTYGGYEVVHVIDTWGPVPINGSGATVRCTIDDAGAHRIKGKTISLCTPDELLSFEREHFPTAYEYKMEQLEASMTGAAL